jgi:hypothetical protein
VQHDRRGGKREGLFVAWCAAHADSQQTATVHARKKDKRKEAGVPCGVGACATMWSFIFPMGTERDDFSAAQLAFKFGARRRLYYNVSV